MKNFILNVGEKLFIPTCIIFISYCIFYRYIAFLPYLIILKVILLLLAAIQIIAWALGKFGNAKRNNKLRLSNNNVVKSFYLHSRRIITLVFSYYFAVYLIFFLDKQICIITKNQSYNPPRMQIKTLNYIIIRQP